MEAAATPVKQSEVVIPETVRFSPDTPASQATMETSVDHKYLPIINIENDASPYPTGGRGIISEPDLKLKEGAANLDYFLAYIYVNQDNVGFMDKLSAYFNKALVRIDDMKDDDSEIIKYDDVGAALRRTNPDAYEKLRETMTNWSTQFDTILEFGSLGNILWENLEVDKPVDGHLPPRGLFPDSAAAKPKRKKSKRKKSKRKKSKRKKSKKSKKKKSFKRFSLK